jgi:hypothetical protein
MALSKGLDRHGNRGSLPTVTGSLLAKQYRERLLSVNFAPPATSPEVSALPWPEQPRDRAIPDDDPLALRFACLLDAGPAAMLATPHPMALLPIALSKLE